MVTVNGTLLRPEEVSLEMLTIQSVVCEDGENEDEDFKKLNADYSEIFSD